MFLCLYLLESSVRDQHFVFFKPENMIICEIYIKMTVMYIRPVMVTKCDAGFAEAGKHHDKRNCRIIFYVAECTEKHKNQVKNAFNHIFE